MKNLWIKKNSYPHEKRAILKEKSLIHQLIHIIHIFLLLKRVVKM